jgi:type IV pilus secretin PilQ/predicted competence protein
MSTRPILLTAFVALLATTPPLLAQAQLPPAAKQTAAPAAPAGQVAPAADASKLADKPAAPEVAVKGDEAAPKGTASKGKDTAGKDTLSVDFPDEDIRNIIRNVADLFELNLSMPDALQGKTTIKLRDVTWRQIFQTVLTPVNYTYIEEGNIIKIVSNDSLTQEPTTTEVFLINYARAVDIMPTITSLVDAASGGKIVVDARSNSLVITERPTRMTRIRPIIEQLDRATDQVMIESKFVEVTNTDVKNIGVNWSSLQNYQLSASKLGTTFDRSRGQTQSAGTNANNGTSDNTTGTQTNGSNTSNTVTATNGAITSTSTTGTTGALTNTSTNTASDALNLLNSIATTGATNRLANAVFSAGDFNLILSALQTQSGVKIVSNPTIVTLNNTEATINVGEQDPIPRYAYSEQHGTFEVNGFDYKDIGIILKVTPQVNARGFIKLTLAPEVSQKNGTTTFGGAGGASIPIIATRKATTTVSLKDGFTMGIGGLLSTNTTKGGNKVPVLGSIPLLGRLFSNSTRDVESTNLIIFITAKTVSAEGASVEQLFDSSRVRDLQLHREDLPGHRDGSDPFLPAAPAPDNAKKPFFRLTAPEGTK